MSHLEQPVQHEIMVALREAGCWCVKVPSGVAYQDSRYIQMAPEGTPDLMVGRADGKFGALEIKKPVGSVLKYKQRLALREIDSLGLCWAVLDDVSQVATWLADPKYHGPAKWVKKVWEEITPSSKPWTPKPHHLDPLIEAHHAKLARERTDVQLMDIPF